MEVGEAHGNIWKLVEVSGSVRIFVVQEQLNRMFKVLYCIVWQFAWIRNRQYRHLRRLCCEILIHSVFTLPEPLLSASYCILFCCSAVTTACSTAAVPSGSRWDHGEATGVLRNSWK